MTVEFISAINVNPSNELNRLGSADVDVPFFARYVNALEDAGFDYTLVPYFSAFQDQFAVANQIVARSERVTPIVALRPNSLYPTVAAKALATLDQFGGGRAVVHFISGGSDAEQAREGDYLPKERRYARTAEYIDIVRKVWTSTTPFSHEGEFYRFENFVSAVRPTNGTIPVSLGGSSAQAYQVGGASADIFGLWGEPLADTQEQIDAVNNEAERAGRADRPRIWVTFRPIIAATDELAWEKAHRILSVLEGSAAGAANLVRSGLGGDAPQNVGSQRLLEIASRQDVHDRALWTPTASATGATGASTALVGTPETVAAAILDYVDLGADLVSIRGYDNLNDLIDYGRHILPLVRQELAHREATGQRGTLQADHPGAYATSSPQPTAERTPA
ncbi:LLM class flavin-dependent oxidoreductase [Frankia sp. CNm7]|uniref:LLM class flavin-dependent oxidoreductase n=1 Tax=Frankia nepalensis TaxID=1836974 RepID=A0A937RFJ2_9ACTN|nr:LLM class flavin-dependent oxidoreductase [Frankia nepalensis]MBL7499838.1 LLM class flavin-dependent oxidoreductase [Frankia nepalensis]MBL7516213.1 LLM class flavin-dependent oxidoreductase [Frankia nepalensis]MBL7519797.1 LLM class flavin-dependent oxidoreductase [Frankia nepalensis]MBL7631266.1 LLM class flavin-dependent oxidoreductase [Frankia nepalensis]